APACRRLDLAVSGRTAAPGATADRACADRRRRAGDPLARRWLGGTDRGTAPRQHWRGTGRSGDDGMTRIRQSGEATMQQRMNGGAIKLSTFIPLQIRKRGVRKVVIRPDGESAGSTTRNQFDSPMLVALARAFYWQQLLDDGVVASGTDIAQRDGLHHSTVNE